MKLSTRSVVYGALLAAIYAVFTLALAPVAYGPLQFRVSNLLEPLALFDPAFSLGLALGVAMSNIYSPFGPLDYLVMPIVTAGAALACYALRRMPVLALLIESLMISAGVAIFPLGLGGHLPVPASFVFVSISQVIILLGAYFILWKPYGEVILSALNRRQSNGRASYTGTNSRAE